MIHTVVARWPPRRRVAFVALLPVVASWFVLAGRGAATPSAGWLVVSLGASGLGAAVLASYVPRVGRRPDLGCTPCSTLAALSLVGATIALTTYRGEVVGPLVATAVLLFGLTQRVGQTASCAAPVRAPR